jgi:hypothetical protein
MELAIIIIIIIFKEERGGQNLKIKKFGGAYSNF